MKSLWVVLIAMMMTACSHPAKIQPKNSSVKTVTPCTACAGTATTITLTCPTGNTCTSAQYVAFGEHGIEAYYYNGKWYNANGEIDVRP